METSPVYFHMIVNHLPIGGLVIGLPVFIYGLVFGKKDIICTATGIFIFAGISAVAAYLTGKEAEEVVESLPGASETLIHIHQKSANLFLVLSGFLGLTAILTLIMVLIKTTFIKYFYYGLIAISLVSLIAATRVGNTGRQIRHTEIRSGDKVIQFQSEDDD